VPVRWNCEVEVFGRAVIPEQLIHADDHGFLAIPEEDEAGLLEAARFVDSTECQTFLAAARHAQGVPLNAALDRIRTARQEYKALVKKQFVQKKGEW
jgi:4-hydroxy-4-methyl-2-oxoglutarate aldolase